MTPDIAMTGDQQSEAIDTLDAVRGALGLALDSIEVAVEAGTVPALLANIGAFLKGNAAEVEEVISAAVRIVGDDVEEALASGQTFDIDMTCCHTVAASLGLINETSGDMAREHLIERFGEPSEGDYIIKVQPQAVH